jgi:Protein of unknown function (DUF2997)
MPQIQITVNSSGQTIAETIGYQGTACQSASRFLEEALGTPQQQVLKSEYYLTTQEVTVVSVRDAGQASA